MGITDIILLAIALGIDCLVVSFSQGLIFKSNRRKNSLNLSFTMGMFQGVMPLIGYIAADKVYNLLIPFSKWIVFAIFTILGLHFILEAITENQKEEIQCIGFKCLLMLGTATSIDALVSGVTIRLTHAQILLTCLIIGIMSFIMSLAGFWSGNKIKNLPSKYLQISGGIILLILAIKSLLV